ncbi:extracellular matrix protein FRAS1 [Silurus meridionalis]|uniref:extracellular matrix protein FRAS1 n=1 Tax=Silurus meridionalis TaxID=175797 RepID=UPI001EEB86BB|nr:extracellular matrix protein FRAS1 [Silurus meridionalis]
MDLVWIVLIACTTFSAGTEGACVHQGVLVGNNTSWKPDACQDCTCHSDVVMCKATKCQNPQCDFQRGERLRIPANRCCPECFPQSLPSCQHQGAVYGHDSQWNESKCSVCTCASGKVTCVPPACPPLSCGRGQTPYVPVGECCPKCARNGASCSWEGKEHRDGELWSPSPCTRCECKDGQTQCSVAECQPITCKPNENLVIQPGQCCPQCISNPCIAGKEYKDGQQWQKSSCTTCVCHRGQSRCHTEKCHHLQCDKGEMKVKRPGQCCEECVSTKGSCLYEGTTRYHEDMWNGTGCEFCTCQRGQVLCQHAECARLECPRGEELLYLNGKCCPECKPSVSSCVYMHLENQNEQSNVKSFRRLANLESVSDGPCRECQCRDGQVTCYQRSCPTCPVGTLAMPQQGECCQECHPAVQCHPDCLACSTTPDQCNSCRDPGAFLWKGHCVHVCPHGFFPKGRVCAACHPSCVTCENDFECTACGGSLLLSGRQCVAACETGLYQDHTQCLSCHDSCSSCQGAGPQDCLSCADPAYLLKNGFCVAECGSGFYVSQSQCHACDSSCATCKPDNPSCNSCPSAYALHHGKCIPDCPDQHYKDRHSRCQLCHSSCASCSGPSATQCSSCPSSLLLHGGECVEFCGEGLFNRDGRCYSCHVSCRACVGPELSDCVRCVKPEEVLQPQNAHVSYGMCLSSCLSQHYLDSDLICRECHESCSHCASGNANSCTSCLQPGVLYNGQCLDRCPHGFHVQDSTCHACHPTCKECSGPSQADCTVCPSHASLHNGYCRTSCPEGQYLNAVGYCSECQEGCQRCTADLQLGSGTVCLWCKGSRMLLLGDHCVQHCPPGHYKYHGACKKCHSSCADCSEEGPLFCSSCTAPNVLAPSGMCTSRCPIGYYADERQVCQKCDRQCWTCEMAGVCTSCRDPEKVLLFGECQYESCAQQYYLNTTTHTCRECDWSCNACRGPLRTDCLQCMEGHVLQNGVCVPSCSPGSYQDGERCLSCDDHCKQCQGPGRCLQCHLPYASLDGQCVLNCGSRYILDTAKQQCVACPFSCVECVNVGQCRICAENMFVKNGQCTPDCGRGYYADRKTRECHANTHAPSLHINGSFLVAVGGVTPLEPALLSVTDSDSQSESLLLQLVQPPSNGQLTVLEHRQERALYKDDTFTLTQVKNRVVRFVHTEAQTKAGQFTLRAADPQLFSLPQTVNLQAVSQQPPVVVTNQPIYIEPSEAFILTRSVLHIEDYDNPQDVLIMVLEPPQHGRLTRVHGDGQVSRFKLEELVREQLQYVHDGSSGEQDTLLLQINDGHSYQNVLVYVNIAQRNGLAPHMRSIPKTWVREGGMVQLSKKHLKAEYKGASDSEILYTIQSDKGQTQYGEIVLVSMAADGPVEAWQAFPEGRDTTPTSSFTQRDVNEGTVWYRHYGRGTQRDSFQFQVSAEAFPDTLSDAQTFTIGVMPQNPGFPQLTPGADLQINALEDRVTLITPSALSFTDSETPSNKLIYNITKLLPPGHGTLEHADRPYSHLRFFTQADVDTGKIIYRPPQAPSHMQELYQYSFTGLPESLNFHFTVSDGHHTTPEMDFSILLLTNHQQPPVFQILDPVLEVSLGGRAPIGGQQLAVTDADTAPDELEFELVEGPVHGNLLRVDFGSQTPMVNGDTFTFNDITRNVLQYEHSGLTTEEDTMIFSVTDGMSMTSTTVQVTVLEVKGDGPRRDPKALLSMEVAEKSSTVIRRSHLAYVDNDSSDNKIRIQLVSVPMYGILTKTNSASDHEELNEYSSFSMEDINHHKIRYVTSFDTGNQPVTDIFHFIVYDAENNRLDNQMCTITITAVQTNHSNTKITNDSCNPNVLPNSYSSKITEQQLKGTDIDSDNLKLKFTVTKDLSVGTLQLHKDRNKVQISAKGPIRSFTQDDINKGLVEYIHEKGESGGSFSFKFNLEDPEGNKVIDESFFITVLEDRLPPAVVVNKGLVLDENSVKKITTLQLSSTDQDSEPGELVYRITKQTQLGHLELSTNSGKRISTFTQADLASRNVQYVHTSEEEHYSDDFTFTVSDGANEISQTFYITIRPVDDSLPMLTMSGMRVQEGVRKTITEFELKATDADTEEDLITFTIVQAPRHGTIERTSNGQHYRQTNTFTMDDIYQNRISYHHDGSNSLKDRFTFTVSDGTNMFFIIEEGEKEGVTAAPQKFKIDILPVDDGTPRIVTNLGLQWLEYMDNRATNLISKKELLTIDPDTDDGQLTYEITAGPRYGYVESKLKPGIPITSFTQAEVNLGVIRYVLNDNGVQETMDNFKFLVKDSKPNIVSDNVFHIQWSLISFEHRSYNVSEKAGTVAVTVKRTGNLNQYAIVLCRTEQGTATSTAGIQRGKHDYVEHAGQVQFDEREDTKVCTIIINDDQVFENIESFTVELSMPVYALLGQVTRAKVNINDTEDEPTLQFDKKTYHINESSGFIHVPIERKGDTSSTVSALCYTIPRSARGSSLHALESGSDYKSRSMSTENRVVLGPGVSMSTCDVTLIDDSEYEPSEEFELVLSDASDNSRMGDITVAKIIIDGPNDASTVFLGNASFSFTEDAGTIEIPVLRRGSDLSSVASVWCATRPADQDTATPGVDYIPSSKKVDFKPGKTEETCSLTIMDDIQNPTIEGKESFIVFLSSPNGAVLTEPYEASVYIIDSTQDLPSMQFEKVAYTVKEKDGVLHIPIIRTGDLTYKSSVRCFTRTMSAMVMDDFEERRNADVSRVVFLKGEKVKNCTVHINDDSVFEPEEEFQVHLGTPQGDHWSGAMIGVNDIVTLTITNDEDAPTIEFEQASYQVREPPGPDGIEVLNIKVIRKGDLDRTSKIRCSTRDGSAQSGVDYNPTSRVLKFSPGLDHILFKVEILSNEEREWHESFSLVLGPDDPVEAVLGEITMATVTILDQEAAGSLILPAPPIVVSLSDYDSVQEVTKEKSKKSPSPGYPLVCVTPCDPHYPKYSVMRERCEEAGINQTSIHFSWEVAAPTDSSGSRSPFETVTDNTPYTTVNHMVLDSIYFSRRFHVRCVAQARDKAGHLGTPLRSNIATIGTEGSICHTPVTTGTARGFQAQSFIATLKYLDVKHKEHPNRIHISVQIPHQDGMLPLVSTVPLHNLHFLLSESIYRQQHICSNLVTLKDLQGISETGFLDDVTYDSISLGPGYDRPYQFNPNIREPRTIQLYKHLNLKSCIWTFDAYYDMTELIDVCGGSVTADFQVRDSAQSFLTVQVPLYVSYIYVTAPRGWASLEHHTEMEFSFFYDTVLWRTGIQTDSVLSARLQIIRIFIKDDGRLVIEFKTHAKFRGQFVPDHHTLPGHKSHLMAPDHLGGIEFDLQLVWSAQTFDSPYQLWRATSSYSRKDYSGEYTVFLIPCTVQPTQPWIDPGDKPLSCTAHAPEKFLLPIAFQQTNRPVPVVYSLNTEFQLCNNEKVFMMDPATTDMSMAEMDYKGAFSMGQTLYGRVLWNPEQNLNSAYKLQLEKVYLCTGRDGYVPFFDPTGTLYNEGPQYGCIQPNKHLKHRFLILDRKQPDVCDRYFHDVPFDASFVSDVPDLQSVSTMPGVDGFTMKVDALYKVEAGHQWYLQVIYVIGPESISSPRVRRSISLALKRDLSEQSVLDESLIYDNEGEQVKNGTNMKALKLELEPSATFDSHTSGSVGGGVAAIFLLVLLFLSTCLLFRKCRKVDKRKPVKNPNMEEYPLNTKVEVERLEKNLKNDKCNVNLLSQSADTWKVNGVKVKQVNLEVKLHNNLNDGTEV